MYDAKNDLWRMTGEVLDYDQRGNRRHGSYLITVDGNGTVKKTDTSFSGLSFYKILGGVDGAYYLIGEEEKAGASYALVTKYDAAGKLLWRQKEQPQAYSYYQDAVLEADAGQIVLAGTMNARNGSGEGGTPFIQALSTDAGGELWRQELTASEFKGTALVSGIRKAPDYGYMLALCGIAQGTPRTPFVIARVNERGYLLK
jgi:hypothetical protein